MADDPLFSKLFRGDQQKYKEQFFKDLPAKREQFFSNTFHQFQNRYIVEFVNGKIITDSIVSTCGMSKRTIKSTAVQHIAIPLSPNTSELISISNNIIQNTKRISLIKKAVEATLNKNSTIEGLAIKWTAYEKYAYLLNSEECARSKIETFASISVNVKIMKNGNVYEGKSNQGFSNEKRTADHKTIIMLIEMAYKDAENSSNSKQVNGGIYDVVFSNNASGVLFHEIVGHLVEADYIFNGRSILKSQLNQKIASSQLTVIDNPLNGSPVEYSVDDEGTPAQRTIIVKDGLLQNFLTDRYHSINMGVKASGNGRCDIYSSLPQPRMSNTQVGAGSYTKEEIIDSTQKGILITDPGNGFIDTQTGGFQFNGASGYYIENGEEGYPFVNLGISGNAIETLTSVKMIGNDFNISRFHADCEKENQILPVGFAQPTIKIASVKIS